MAVANQDKILKGVLKGVLKEIGRGKEDSVAFEKVAAAEIAKAREGKGLISGAIAAAKAKSRVTDEYKIATQGTMGRRTAFFEGLLGRDLGSLVKDLGLEKVESIEKINETRKKFGLDKKEKKDRMGGGVGQLAKPLSLILRNVIQTQKMVRGIEKVLTKPSIKAGYTFDPRMAGGGKFKNAEGKMVSSKEAMESGGPSARTSALTAAIGADEQPLVKLREFLEEKFKDFDAKKLKETTESTKFSLNGMTPTIGLLSVHDKLNILMAKSALGGIDLPNRRTPPGRTPPGKKPPGKFAKVGGALSKAARVVGKVAAPLAVGMAAYDAYSGYTDAENVLGLEKGKTATTGQKLAAGAGSAISGLTFGLVDEQKTARFLSGYDPDEQRLINNWAYSVHIGKAKLNQVPKQLLDGVKELLKKPPKNWGKASAAPPKTVNKTAPTSSQTPPTPSVTTATPSALPGAATVAAATTTAAAIPAAAGGGAAPSAPPPSGGPSRRLGPAAAARGKISASEGRNAALAAAAKAGITGPHLAQFMAQLDHESGGFKVVEENLRYSAKRLLEIFPKYYKDPAQAEADANQPQAIANRVYANRMGNGPPESGDGYRYRGRGLIQLTGKDNYKRFGQLAGIDLVSNPDMAGNLGTAADIAAAFYKKNVIDKGIDAQNTAKVTKAINGGSIGLSHRESLFASYMKDAGSLQPTGQMLAGGPEPEPSATAKGQDVKVGGDVSGAAPTESKQQMVAASSQSQATPAAATPSAQSLAPVESTTGTQVAQGSSQLESSKMVAQAAPSAPVVINNNQGGSQQPITPPKTPMPKASSRSNESTFSRALAKDFSHPSAFTSTVA